MSSGNLNSEDSGVPFDDSFVFGVDLVIAGIGRLTSRRVITGRVQNVEKNPLERVGIRKAEESGAVRT